MAAPATAFYNGYDSLLQTLDESKRRNPSADLRRQTLKHIISSLAVLDPDDPLTLLNDMLDKPSAIVTKSWMNARMSPALTTGAKQAEDDQARWYGAVPSYFPSAFAASGASSPTKPAMIIDSRKRQVHELRPVHLDKASRKKLFSGVANVEQRLARLLGRTRGSTPRLPSSRRKGGGGDATANTSPMEAAVAAEYSAEFAIDMMELAMEACTGAAAAAGAAVWEDSAAAAAAAATATPPEQFSFEGSIMCVLGGPGAGKTTHCSAIASGRGCTHIHLGKEIRKRIERGAPDAEELRKCVASGHLVDDATVFDMLRDGLQEAAAQGAPGPYLLDGFPRNLDQARRLCDEFGVPHSVLVLDLPEEVMSSRVLKRGESSGREDDNSQALEALFEQFADDILPVLDFFEKHTSVHRVDASVATADVTNNLEATIAASTVATSLVSSLVRECLAEVSA